MSKEGYLTKQGAFIKNWKRRFFTLSQSSNFITYQEAPNAKILGNIPLDKISAVTILDDFQGRNFCFSLTLPFRTFYISAENEEDMRSWVDAIKIATTFEILKPPDGFVELISPVALKRVRLTLSGDRLEYNNPDGEKKGEILLSGLAGEPGRAPGSREFSFECREPKQTRYVFSCDDEDSCKRWVSFLRYIVKPQIKGADTYGAWAPIQGHQMESYLVSLMVTGTWLHPMDQEALYKDKKIKVIYEPKVSADPVDNDIIKAAAEGRRDILEKKLKEGKKRQVVFTDHKGQTALIKAAQIEKSIQYDVLGLLIGHNADVNWADVTGRRALHYAAEIGNEKAVETLLRNYADVSARDMEGLSPYDLAQMKGHAAICKKINDFCDQFNLQGVDHPDKKMIDILEGGLPVNWRDTSGRSLLHRAVEQQMRSVVEVLLSRDAHIDVMDNCRLTPLHLSALHFPRNPSREEAQEAENITKLLLKFKANPFLSDNNLYTPLHLAVWVGNFPFVRNLVEMVGNEGISTVGHLRDRVTPLHIAAEKNHVKIIEFLLGHGASLETQDRNGQTPLEKASGEGFKIIKAFGRGADFIEWVKKGNVKEAKSTLSLGVPVDFIDPIFGRTALHWACEQHNPEMVHFLLQSHINVHLRDFQKKTAKELLNPANQVSAKIHQEIESCSIIRNLFDHMRVGSEKILQSLGEAEKLLVKESRDRLGNTLLHKAAQGGYEPCVEELLDSLEVNSKNLNGDTPLMLACEGGHVQCVRVLLSRSPDLDVQGAKGNTALHLAVGNGSVDTVLELLQAGASLSIKNDFHSTPIEWAKESHHEKMVPLLHWFEIGRKLIWYIREADLPNARPLLDEDNARQIAHAVLLGNRQSNLSLTDLKEQAWDERLDYKISLILTNPLFRPTVEENADPKDFFQVIFQKFGGKPDWMPDLVNFVDANRDTPLIAAVCSRVCSTCVPALLENGADVYSTNAKNQRPSEIARENGLNDIALQIEQHGRGTRLLNLCAKGEEPQVKKLLEEDSVDVNWSNALGETPLLVAAEKGHHKCVETLLRYGADVKKCSKWGGSPLHAAVLSNDPDTIESLLVHGAQLEVVTNLHKVMPIELAKKEGKAKALKILLLSQLAREMIRAVENNNQKEFMDFYREGKFGDALNYSVVPERNTVLHVAVLKQNFDLTQIILQKGGNLYSKNIHGQTPMQIPTSDKITNLLIRTDIGNRMKPIIRQDDEKKLVDLLNHPNMTSKSWEDISTGSSPLHWAAGWNSIRCLELLLQKFNINAEDNDGFTALHYACWFGHLEAVRVLMTLKANPNIRNNQKQTPLSLVLLAKHKAELKSDLICVLVENGANPNVTDEKGTTALILAASFNDENSLEKLLAFKETDVDVLDNQQHSALTRAVGYGNTNCMALLIKKGSKYAGEALLIAAKNGNKELITILLETVRDSIGEKEAEQVANYRGVNLKQATALSLASLHNNPECASLLLKFKANPNQPGYSNYYPLEIAVFCNSLEVAQVLLNNEVPPENIADIIPSTKSKDMKHLLLSHVYGHKLWSFCDTGNYNDLKNMWNECSADEKRRYFNPEFINPKTGTAAIHAAVSKGHELIVDFLIQKCGFNPHVKSKDGFECSYYCAKFQRPEISQKLDQYEADLKIMTDVSKMETQSATDLLQSKPTLISLRDPEGNTLLHVAVRAERSGLYWSLGDMVELLVARGVDCKAQNRWNQTPLHMALVHQNQEALQLLFEKAKNKLDINTLRDCDGKTAQDLVLEKLGEATPTNNPPLTNFLEHVSKLPRPPPPPPAVPSPSPTPSKPDDKGQQKVFNEKQFKEDIDGRFEFSSFEKERKEMVSGFGHHFDEQMKQFEKLEDIVEFS